MPSLLNPEYTKQVPSPFYEHFKTFSKNFLWSLTSASAPWTWSKCSSSDSPGCEQSAGSSHLLSHCHMHQHHGAIRHTVLAPMPHCQCAAQCPIADPTGQYDIWCGLKIYLSLGNSRYYQMEFLSKPPNSAFVNKFLLLGLKLTLCNLVCESLLPILQVKSSLTYFSFRTREKMSEMRNRLQSLKTTFLFLLSGVLISTWKKFTILSDVSTEKVCLY